MSTTGDDMDADEFRDTTEISDTIMDTHLQDVAAKPLVLGFPLLN